MEIVSLDMSRYEPLVACWAIQVKLLEGSLLPPMCVKYVGMISEFVYDIQRISEFTTNSALAMVNMMKHGPSQHLKHPSCMLGHFSFRWKLESCSSTAVDLPTPQSVHALREWGQRGAAG